MYLFSVRDIKYYGITKSLHDLRTRHEFFYDVLLVRESHDVLLTSLPSISFLPNRYQPPCILCGYHTSFCRIQLHCYCIMFRINSISFFASLLLSSLEVVRSTTLLLTDERVSAFAVWAELNEKQYETVGERDRRLMTWAANDGRLIRIPIYKNFFLFHNELSIISCFYSDCTNSLCLLPTILIFSS
jgi:hypothetical protein